MLMAGVFFIGRAVLGEVDRGNRIKEEVALLQSEAQKVQSENNTLEERIRYFQTDAFQEQEAKQKLNYQSPNEKVVIVKPAVYGDSISQEDTAKEMIDSGSDALIPNYQKWWRHFFGS